MFKIYHAILKELRLIQSDWLGFALIFLMPLVLIVTVTFIQDSIESGENKSLTILLVNNDEGEISQSIIQDLEKEGIFTMIAEKDGKKLEESSGKKLIKEGKEQILLIVPPEFSTYIQEKTDERVSELLARVEGEEKPTTLKSAESEKEIEIFFDPALQSNIKNSIKNAFDKVIYEMETKAIYETFEKEFEVDFSFVKEESIVEFKESSVNIDQEKLTPTAVQHNFPAWALFAIFFIVLPLSIN